MIPRKRNERRQVVSFFNVITDVNDSNNILFYVR
jgi:hypothetical protein